MDRVLVFHPALAPYRLDLFNALNKLVHLKLVFLDKNLQNQKFDQSALLRQLEPDWVNLRRSLLPLNRWVPHGIYAQLVSFSPSVVITHEFSPLSFWVAFYRRVFRLKFRHVVWSADYSETLLRDSKVRMVSRYLLLKFLDGLILYTENIKEIYVNNYGFSHPVGISPNIQSEIRVAVIKKRALIIARKYLSNLKIQNTPVILYVGRLSPEKNLTLLLKSFAEIIKKDETLQLCIVGSGPDEENLKEVALELFPDQNRVLFPGRFEGPELFAWYLMAGLFVLPSTFEPYGAVVNEALLSGLPVLCSKKAGASTLINEGVNGDLFDPDDVDELGKKLEMWIDQIPMASERLAAFPAKSLMPISFEDAVAGWLHPCMGTTVDLK